MIIIRLYECVPIYIFALKYVEILKFLSKILQKSMATLYEIEIIICAVMKNCRQTTTTRIYDGIGSK